MSHKNYPEKGDYPSPKKNILVLSCIDLRLTDNLVEFLNFDNLQNRYDHFALAGTSLLTTKEKAHLFEDGAYKQHKSWDATLFAHIDIAIKLHHIEDVYIIEHENCGAYSEFLDQRHKEADLSTLEAEIKCHRMFSDELAKRIAAKNLNAHCFFIDLRGNVKLLSTHAAVPPPKKSPRAAPTNKK